MTYRCALIGCGRVGVTLEDDPLRAKPASHIGGIVKLGPQKVNLVATCDIDKEKLLYTQRQWGIEAVYLDYKELIQKEKPDIIVVATWTQTHKDIVVFAAQNGVKGIVLEKPMATDLESSNEIIKACTIHQVKLVINHERRWDPLYRKAKEIVDNETLGSLKSIYCNVFSRSAPKGAWESVLEDFGGGPLLHDGTHLVDMIRYLSGEIVSINGYVRRENPDVGTETTATAMMETDKSVNVFMEAGGMRNYFNFELDLQFEEGRIRVGNGIKEYFQARSSTRYTGFRDLVKGKFPKLERGIDPFSGAISELIDSMEKNTIPLSSLDDGYRAMEIIFGIYYSAYVGGKSLKFPLKISGHPLKKMFQTHLL